MSTPLPTNVPPPVWRGPLGQLIHALTRQLDGLPSGTWARYALAKGACVSLCRVDGRRTILFSRPTLPQSDQGWVAWSNEVNVFIGWFLIQKWEPTEDLPAGAHDGLTAPLWSAYLEPPPASDEGF